MSQATPTSRRFVVAVTGGIAAGKSAVTSAFERRNVACYDADSAARAVVAVGQPALQDICREFGTGVLDARGELDRASVRRRVFADPAARQTLEAIIHPRVRQWLRHHVDQDSGAYCLLAIPLLAETWPAYDWVNRVLVVDVSPELQLQRLQQRDGIDRALALQMIQAQATRAQRLAIANDVLDNSGALAELELAVDALHQRYLALAAAA